jgi:uncharacterized protein DUF4339
MTDRRTQGAASENGRSLDWYYRIGDRERGPMTLEEIKNLVAASGELARTVEVRQHADGAWIPYEAVDDITARRLHADHSNASRPPAVARPTARSGDGDRSAIRPRLDAKALGERLRRNWPIGAGLLVLAALNLAFWFFLDPFYSTERRYLQVLTEAGQKARDARANGLDGAERTRISAAVVRDVKPMVESLKKSAAASQPIRQHLLWAAENELPKLFSGSGNELEQSDAIFQRHLHEAGRLMGIDLPQPPTSVVFK